MQVCDWRRARQREMTAAGEFPASASNQQGRERVGAVGVTVGHVRAVEEQRVIQHCAFAVLDPGQLTEELREAFHVPGLDLDKPLDLVRLVSVMGYGVERIGNADMVIR